MGEVTNEIEREIRDRRQELGRNLNELEDKARELTDWRTHYRNHSGLFLSVAFSAGVVAGLTMIPKADRHAGGDDYEAPEPEALADPDAYRARHAVWTGRPAGSGSGSSGTGTMSRLMRQAGDTWSEITDALLKAASARAVQFVSDLVPDTRDYLKKI